MKVLYILMRSDLNSLNPGKACAQAAHAANKFVCLSRYQKSKKSLKDLREWIDESDGQGFGTTIVLDGMTWDKISKILEEIRESEIPYIHCGVVHDSTYPIKDGLHTHLIPIFTCAYVFGEKDTLVPFLSVLNLYP